MSTRQAELGEFGFAGDDRVVPFQVEGLDVRGRAVQLGPLINTILDRHAYPAPVARLLAEAIVLTVLIGTSLKFEGKFTVQTKGNGPVDLLVADFTTPENVRAYARFDEQLGLGLKPRGIQRDLPEYLRSDEAITTLTVPDMLAGAPGEYTGSQSIAEPPVPGHPGRPVHARSDDDCSRLRFPRFQKLRNLTFIMLTIRIHGDNGFIILFQCPVETGTEGSAFTTVLWMPDQIGSGILGCRRRVVCRAVVDH